MSDPVDLAATRPSEAEGLADDTLEELNRLWTIVRAFSTTAHDVNNALQVIAGSAELLEARELEPAVRRRVEIVRQESGKAAATINRLLDYVRMARQPAERLDVWPLLDAAIAMRQASIGRSRIALGVQREGAGPAWIVADRGRVLQALLNLLLVAEAHAAGRAKARIDVSVDTAPRGVSITLAIAGDAAPAVAEEGQSAARRLTRDAELWAAAYLAALYGGVVTSDAERVAVSWPPEN
jgi:signal transduction histidine kinase